ncbi:MAG: outer membrane protein transport protein [Pirellula sp.]
MKLNYLLVALSMSVTFSGSLWAESIVPALGAKSAGRAGTNLAFDDNAFVFADNPAGLIGATFGSCCTTTVMEGNIAGLFPDLKYSDPQNPGARASNDPFGLGAFTIAKRIDEDLALGFGVYSPAGFGARWNLEGPPGPLAGPQFYKSIGMLVRVLPGVSYQATDRLRIGSTLGIALSHLELEGPHFLTSAPLTGTPTVIDLQSTGAALTWSAGLQYKLSDELTVAGHYQSQNRFQNNGNATVAIPGMGTSYYDLTMDFVWPRVAGVGMMYRPSPITRIGIDVDWQQWSTAMNSVDLHFRNPNNPIFLAVAGPQVFDSLPLRWKDNIVVKTGIERDIAANKTVRIGYSHNNDAVRGSTMTPYLPTILSHYFTTGFGWKRKCWEYDAAYQYSFRPTIRTGQSELVGGDQSGSTSNTQAHWLFLGAAKKF